MDGHGISSATKLYKTHARELGENKLADVDLGPVLVCPIAVPGAGSPPLRAAPVCAVPPSYPAGSRRRRWKI